MKIHKFEIIVYDFEDYGKQEYETLLIQSSDMDCRILSSKTVDIGE